MTGRSTTRVVKKLTWLVAYVRKLGLMVCLSLSANAQAVELSPVTAASGNVPPPPWHVVGLPERYAKPWTQFDVTNLDGKRVLRVQAHKAYGNLVHKWSGPASSLQFKWRLDTPLLRANLKDKNTEDIALKVCVSFDLPVDSIPASERAKFKLAQFFSPDKLPTATLCYIWDHTLPVGNELRSPYTGRVRYIVVNSGEAQLKTWQEHQRNIAADFLRSFGQEASTVPAVTAIIVGADSDNTGDSSLGYVADISVQP